MYLYNISDTMYSTWELGMRHRKAEEAHKEGGNVAVQVLTKCGCILEVVMPLVLM